MLTKERNCRCIIIKPVKETTIIHAVTPYLIRTVHTLPHLSSCLISQDRRGLRCALRLGGLSQVNARINH